MEIQLYTNQKIDFHGLPIKEGQYRGLFLHWEVASESMIPRVGDRISFSIERDGNLDAYAGRVVDSFFKIDSNIYQLLITDIGPTKGEIMSFRRNPYSKFWDTSIAIAAFITFAVILLMLLHLFSGCSNIEKLIGGEEKGFDLPGWTIESYELSSVADGKYTIYSKGNPTYALWYFAGLGCNDKILKGTGCPYIAQEGTSEIALMESLNNVVVISVSFGEAWLADPLPPKTMANVDATVPNFQTKILPEIEKRHTAGSKDCVSSKTKICDLKKPYKAIGHSMGGFNAAQLCMAGDIFDRCALVHPMFIKEDPYLKSWTQCLSLQSLLESGDILAGHPECLAGPAFISQEFPKEKWPKVDPIYSVKLAAKMPPTKVFVNNHDDFNLIAGPKEFARNGQLAGLPITIVTYDEGNHYVYPSKAIVDYLEGREDAPGSITLTASIVKKSGQKIVVANEATLAVPKEFLDGKTLASLKNSKRFEVSDPVDVNLPERLYKKVSATAYFSMNKECKRVQMKRLLDRRNGNVYTAFVSNGCDGANVYGLIVSGVRASSRNLKYIVYDGLIYTPADYAKAHSGKKKK